MKLIYKCPTLFNPLIVEEMSWFISLEYLKRVHIH